MPASADALIARGNAHYAMKSFAAALADYDSAASLRPDAAPVHNNRGNALRELGRREDALAAFDRALALKPDYAEAHNNRGNALLELNRVTEALACYERALALKPDFVDALVNRGNALRYLARPQDAIASFDRALALNPQLPEAHWNKGLACLSLGDFARGWQGYEWRWRRSNSEMTPRDFAQPQWRGEDLRGRTILLHAEQGFGDSIQFIRYLPMVVAKGAKVILEIPDDLRPLIRIDGVAAILRRGDALPNFDVHCPLMSLPLAFGTTLATIPAPVPYLHAPAERVEKWRARLAGTTAPRVGLVWSGKPTHTERHQPQHSPGAACAAAGAAGRHLRQPAKGPPRGRPRGARAKSPHPPRRRARRFCRHRGGHRRARFGDRGRYRGRASGRRHGQAAVDPAAGHRRLALDELARADSPWYPSARLFRQPQIGDWQSAIADVTRELALFAPKGAQAATH